MTASLPEGFGAIVLGASGAIGGALVARLRADPRAGRVLGLARSAGAGVDIAGVDLTAPQTLAPAVARAREALGGVEPRLVLIATGGLTIDGRGPEKRLADLDASALAAQFALNAIGPALVLAAFLPLVPRRGRSLIGALSARVGSIGDNRLGGWHGYRAAKAALNQLLRGAAIELARTHPEAVVAALHPGTVESALTRPFRPEGAAEPGVLSPAQSAERLLGVLDRLTPAQSGGFFDQNGAEVPW